MPVADDPLRKAAVLVACLDRASADALLEQMRPDEADRVRRAAAELEVIDPAEQERVIREFLGQGSEESPVTAAAPAGRPHAVAPLSAPSDRSAGRWGWSLGGGRPFGFLLQAASQQLTPFLEGEHPQTIAVIVSHLPPERAVELLANLAPALQAEVIRRLVDLDETHPEIVREVERGLESRISELAQTQQRRAAGLAAVRQILEAAGRSAGRNLLANLAQHAPELARQLGSGETGLSFEDLGRLDDLALRELVAAADADLLGLALAGSSEALVERFTRQLPPGQARLLEQSWRHFLPTGLSDVDEAQRELVRLAEELEGQGRISLPSQTAARSAPVEYIPGML